MLEIEELIYEPNSGRRNVRYFCRREKIIMSRDNKIKNITFYRTIFDCSFVRLFVCLFACLIFYQYFNYIFMLKTRTKHQLKLTFMTFWTEWIRSSERWVPTWIRLGFSGTASLLHEANLQERAQGRLLLVIDQPHALKKGQGPSYQSWVTRSMRHWRRGVGGCTHFHAWP